MLNYSSNEHVIIEHVRLEAKYLEISDHRQFLNTETTERSLFVKKQRETEEPKPERKMKKTEKATW